MFLSESCVVPWQGLNAGFPGLPRHSPSFWKRHPQDQLRFCLRRCSGVEECLDETHPAVLGHLKHDSSSYRTPGTVSL